MNENPAFSAGLTAFDAPVLALDTALNGCVVAVYDPKAGAVTAKRTLETDRGQAAELVPLVQAAMAEAGIAFADLGLIVTTRGPGSFTGLRIGLSTARSFAMALDVPLHGTGSLAVMAACCVEKGRQERDICVLLETKRQDFYVQVFAPDLSPITAPVCAAGDMIARYEGLDNMLVCGDAVERFVMETGFAPAETRTRRLFDPATLVQFGAKDYLAKGRPQEKIEPLYLRGADVSMSNKKQREIQNFPQ